MTACSPSTNPRLWLYDKTIPSPQIAHEKKRLRSKSPQNLVSLDSNHKDSYQQFSKQGVKIHGCPSVACLISASLLRCQRPCRSPCYQMKGPRWRSPMSVSSRLPPRGMGKKNIYVGVGCGDASDQQDCYMLGSAGSTGSTIKPKICHWYWEGATAR